LRHLERTRVLIHLLEVSPVPGRTPLRDYLALRRELELYDPALAERAEIVVLSKVDLPSTRTRLGALRASFARRKVELLAMSSVTGQGVTEVLEAAFRALASARRAQA
jgi:GTP-binding protein